MLGVWNSIYFRRFDKDDRVGIDEDAEETEMLLEHALLYIAVPIISFSLLVYIFYILKRRHRSAMNIGYPYPPPQRGPIPTAPVDEEAPPYGEAVTCRTDNIFAITEPDLSRYYNFQYVDECYPPNFIAPPSEPPPPYPGLEKGPPPLDPIVYHRDDIC
ncbi:unnamed protein product [Caenorhabditis sp. 36 PRJEB53466]|nr:unnamed protein product [Caenorhabditis sp. 36 PRJEB53466]